MSWSKHHSRGKRGYHHGNLREALVQAALSLIGERGSEGVTLAEAARMAGVSAAAPYRHFKDREALMAAVAAEGYAKFADALETAWGDGDTVDPAAERVYPAGGLLLLPPGGMHRLAARGDAVRLRLAVLDDDKPVPAAAALLE